MKIGVIISSFRLPADQALERAAAVGADGVQIWCAGGELTAESLAPADRRALRRRTADLKLEISALCADFGHGYANAAELDWLLPRTRAAVDLAVDLEVIVITTHIGVVPHDRNVAEYGTMLRAMAELGGYAAGRGVRLATETGPEDAKDVAAFLREVGSEGLAVNYDPANLVMNGFDHIEGVRVLAPWIVHTHAKDAVRHADGRGEEVPLGDGSVGFPRYLDALRSVGFDGYLTIEREVGENPERDIRAAVTFLRSLGV